LCTCDLTQKGIQHTFQGRRSEDRSQVLLKTSGDRFGNKKLYILYTPDRESLSSKERKTPPEGTRTDVADWNWKQLSSGKKIDRKWNLQEAYTIKQ